MSAIVCRVMWSAFTVADADRETTFFTKVLSFEKVSDFRVIGSEYDKMEGVFNTNMRIVHLKLGEQMVESRSTSRLPRAGQSQYHARWRPRPGADLLDDQLSVRVTEQDEPGPVSSRPVPASAARINRSATVWLS